MKSNYGIIGSEKLETLSTSPLTAHHYWPHQSLWVEIITLLKRYQIDFQAQTQRINYFLFLGRPLEPLDNCVTVSRLKKPAPLEKESNFCSSRFLAFPFGKLKAKLCFRFYLSRVQSRLGLLSSKIAYLQASESMIGRKNFLELHRLFSFNFLYCELSTFWGASDSIKKQ